MIYPKFLSDGDTIGVTACSCGILKKIDKYQKTKKVFEEHGFSILETNNVFTEGFVSGDAKTRWNEFKSLLEKENVSAIAIASGGDFLFEMLPYIDRDCIKKNIKWIMGSSDPSSLLYFITTVLDIATIYSPCNMCGMDAYLLHPSYEMYFSILKGNLERQYRYPCVEDEKGDFSIPNEWIVSQTQIDETGVLIGGCIECLKDCIGTPYDGTHIFINKYGEQGIIWYFDIFNMSPETLCNTLIQFREAGWFFKTRAILFGNVRFPSSYSAITYEEAIRRAIDFVPTIYKFDIGHVKPSFTMINGAMVHLYCDKDNQYMEYKEI